jgi:hypothetical protein
MSNDISPYDESASGAGDDELCCVPASSSLVLVSLVGFGGDGSGVGKTRKI